MSSTSTAISLTAHDQTLGDDLDLVNHMCVLTITSSDGTLFDANSLQEEDVVELCVGMEQAHPKGVLQLLAMELVVAFQSSKEMLAMACLVTMAMVWHDDPIRLYYQPPTAAQIKEFITRSDRCPSGTLALIPSGHLVPSSSPSEEGTQQQFHLALRDLDDAQP